MKITVEFINQQKGEGRGGKSNLEELPRKKKIRTGKLNSVNINSPWSVQMGGEFTNGFKSQ